MSINAQIVKFLIYNVPSSTLIWKRYTHACQLHERTHKSLYIFVHLTNQRKMTARKRESEKESRKNEHWIRSKPQQCIIHVKLLLKNPFGFFSFLYIRKYCSNRKWWWWKKEKNNSHPHTHTTLKNNVLWIKQWRQNTFLSKYHHYFLISHINFSSCATASSSRSRGMDPLEETQSTSNMKWVWGREKRVKRRERKRAKKNNNQIIIILCSVPYYIIQETV